VLGCAGYRADTRRGMELNRAKRQSNPSSKHLRGRALQGSTSQILRVMIRRLFTVSIRGPLTCGFKCDPLRPFPTLCALFVMLAICLLVSRSVMVVVRIFPARICTSGRSNHHNTEGREGMSSEALGDSEELMGYPSHWLFAEGTSGGKPHETQEDSMEH
jgi:hypothetical protein